MFAKVHEDSRTLREHFAKFSLQPTVGGVCLCVPAGDLCLVGGVCVCVFAGDLLVESCRWGLCVCPCRRLASRVL